MDFGSAHRIGRGWLIAALVVEALRIYDFVTLLFEAAWTA